MTEINAINAAKASNLTNTQAKAALPDVPFKTILKESLDALNPKEVKGIEYNFNYKQPEKFDDEMEILAQGLDPNEIEDVLQEVRRRRGQQNLEQTTIDEDERLSGRMRITPFQMFIDKAVEVLENISEMDHKVNDLTEQYAQGKISVDEISIEITKLNLMVSFATTVLSSGTAAFKEVLTMQV